jgi:transposase
MPMPASTPVCVTMRGIGRQQIAGVGPVFAAIFVADIGDVGRFDNVRRLCSWAGLTPRLRESDAHTHRGHITQQGSRLLR